MGFVYSLQLEMPREGWKWRKSEPKSWGELQNRKGRRNEVIVQISG